MSAAVYVLSALIAMSVPVLLYLIIGKKKRLAVPCLIAGSAGVLTAVADVIAYAVATGSLEGDVRGWSDDFFRGSLLYIGVFAAVLSALLLLSAVSGKRMRRVRLVLFVLCPFAVIAFGALLASPAAGGAFPVDTYILALVPGAAALVYFALAAESAFGGKMR